MKALPASRMKKLAKQAVAAEVGELDELKRKWQDEIQTDIARQLTAAVLFAECPLRLGQGQVQALSGRTRQHVQRHGRRGHRFTVRLRRSDRTHQAGIRH